MLVLLRPCFGKGLLLGSLPNPQQQGGSLAPLPRLWSIQKFQDRFVKMLAFSNRSSDQKTTDEDWGPGGLLDR